MLVIVWNDASVINSSHSIHRSAVRKTNIQLKLHLCGNWVLPRQVFTAPTAVLIIIIIMLQCLLCLLSQLQTLQALRGKCLVNTILVNIGKHTVFKLKRDGPIHLLNIHIWLISGPAHNFQSCICEVFWASQSQVETQGQPNTGDSASQLVWEQHSVTQRSWKRWAGLRLRLVPMQPGPRYEGENKWMDAY